MHADIRSNLYVYVICFLLLAASAIYILHYMG